MPAAGDLSPAAPPESGAAALSSCFRRESPAWKCKDTGSGMSDVEPKDERARRLADALRANLKRRKAQAKSRRAGEADVRGGLVTGAGAAESATGSEQD